MRKKVLILPCATQIGVEQFYSLEYNKHFDLIGASHNKDDALYKNFIQLRFPIKSVEFIQEVVDIVKKHSIDIILPAHDEVIFILKNDSNLSPLIPGSDSNIVTTCRFKSKTYDTLKKHDLTTDFIPEYKLLSNMFLKPDKGQGSRGTFNVDEPYLLCEYLPGDEFTIDCFSDSDSKMLYAVARLRKVIRNGISETTQIVDNKVLNKLSYNINKVLQFIGAWFYQVKIDKHGNFKVLEVAPRIAGGSNINRLNGVNLTALTLYQHLDISVKINAQSLVKEIDRISPRYNLDYTTIFLDYDDTFMFVRDTIRNLNKKVIVLTRSKTKVDAPYEIIYVNDDVLKSEIINEIGSSDSIFIDDSFKERQDVMRNCRIPCFNVEEVKYLL